jgi:glucose/arabinose dehydrogenase
MMSLRRAVSTAVTLPLLLAATAAQAVAALPTGFVDEVVFSRLTAPTKLVFAPDGRVFVAQKNGVVLVYSGLTDTTPTVFADLRTQVYDYSDLGLLGLAVSPRFPVDPWVYVSYTYDAPVGGTAPVYRDTCPTPGGCVVSGRVSRLRAVGEVSTGAEQVLVNDWCQPSDTHSLGDLAFGPDGALYVSGGEGATDTVDYGQVGTPVNPCGDPPSPVGGPMTPPTAQGGALRAQDPRTTADPTGLSGTVIRIDPATGAGLPDNPLAASTDPNARRIVAYGLRNPFRWTFRPGTRDLYLGDVGWRDWEEIDRLADPLARPVANFGWPCYEGPGRQAGFDAADLTLCETLYAAPAVVAPRFAYRHGVPVVPDDGCPATSGAVTGLAFYPGTGGNYPARFFGALFFTDLVRHCVWAVKPGGGGAPNPNYVLPLGSTVGAPVDLELGPDRNLYYVSITSGTVRRFVYRR